MNRIKYLLRKWFIRVWYFPITFYYETLMRRYLKKHPLGFDLSKPITIEASPFSRTVIIIQKTEHCQWVPMVDIDDDGELVKTMVQQFAEIQDVFTFDQVKEGARQCTK